MKRGTWTFAIAVLLTLLAAPPAMAQAPGTLVLDLVVHAGPVELRPGPLAVPNPWLPNPAYEASSTMNSLVQAPLAVHDTEQGLYLETPGGAMRVAGWTEGVEQRHIAPVELAGQVLEQNHGLPIGLGGCACPAPGPFSVVGFREVTDVLVPSLGASNALAGAVPPLHDERSPGHGGVLAGLRGAADYQAPLVDEAGDDASSQAQQVAPAGTGEAAPFLAAAIAAVGLVLLKLLLPLYHRFKKKTALDNATRKQLYEMLRAAPGASATELSQTSGLHVTTVKYHLDVLRQVGMVGEQLVDGCRRFYSYENGDRMEFLSRALLDEPAARAIYRQIERCPGLSLVEVARTTGMRKEHVYYHVKKLTRHGLVADRWEAGRRLLFTAAAHPGPASARVATVPIAAAPGRAAEPLFAPVLAVASTPEVKG